MDISSRFELIQDIFEKGHREAERR